MPKAKAFGGLPHIKIKSQKLGEEAGFEGST